MNGGEVNPNSSNPKEDGQSLSFTPSDVNRSFVDYMEELYINKVKEKDKIINELQKAATKTGKKDSLSFAETLKCSSGTLLMILSGLILYLDKIINYFNITIDYQFKYYYDFESAVWHLSQTLSPLLIIASLFFKPKRWSYASPVAAFSIQLMFILRDEHFIERDFFWAYTAAFAIFFFAMVFFAQKMLGFVARKIAGLKQKIRYLLRLIVIDIRKKHIAPEKEEHYVNDVVFPTLKEMDK